MTQLAIATALLARGYALDTPAGFKGAVQAFQRDAGLTPDGSGGPKTEAALARPISARPAGTLPPIAGFTALLTVARLRRAEPFGRADILAAIVSNTAAIQAVGITTPLRLAHFLAQVAHETRGFARLEENLNYSAERLVEVWPKRFPTLAAAAPYTRNPRALAIKTYGGRLGNAPAPSSDGWDFRGSSGLMTTGRDNFREAGAEADPERLRSLAGFLDPALLYWRTRGCSALADRDDCAGVTLKINGGAIGLADRMARLATFKRALFT